MKTVSCPSCAKIINVSARKKELKAEKPEPINIHGLESAIRDVQDMRMRFAARFTATQTNAYGVYADDLLTLEDHMKGLAEGETKKYPIYKWIIAQKGLSYDLAGQLIGLIQDISRFDNISKLWAYFGLAVIDRCVLCNKRYYSPEKRSTAIQHIADRLKEQNDKKIVKQKKTDFLNEAIPMICQCESPKLIKTTQKATKGSLLDYNPECKKLAYKIEVQFIKQGSLYRRLFDQFKAEYSARPDLAKQIAESKGKQIKIDGEVIESSGTAHVNNMAKRKMIKIFLQHLWIEWRQLEGLRTSDPYVIEHLGHTKYIEPEVTMKELITN